VGEGATRNNLGPQSPSGQEVSDGVPCLERGSGWRTREAGGAVTGPLTLVALAYKNVPWRNRGTLA
jgi:hypothetical protein